MTSNSWRFMRLFSASTNFVRIYDIPIYTTVWDEASENPCVSESIEGKCMRISGYWSHWWNDLHHCLFLPISKIWVCVRMRKREREFAAEWDSEKTGFTHKLSVKVPLPLITQFSLWKLLIFKRTEIRTKKRQQQQCCLLTIITSIDVIIACNRYEWLSLTISYVKSSDCVRNVNVCGCWITSALLLSVQLHILSVGLFIRCVSLNFTIDWVEVINWQAKVPSEWLPFWSS